MVTGGKTPGIAVLARRAGIADRCLLQPLDPQVLFQDRPQAAVGDDMVCATKQAPGSGTGIQRKDVLAPQAAPDLGEL